MNKPKTKKTAAQIFTRCPQCNCEELIEVDADVLCARCPWDSCKFSVDLGLMDALITQGLRFSEPRPLITSTTQPNHDPNDSSIPTEECTSLTA